MEKRLIKTELEDLEANNDKDLDEDLSSVEKLLIKMEPEDLNEDKNIEEAKKWNWILNR